MTAEVTQILDFWFAQSAEDPQRAADRMKFWYGSGPEVDADIEARFAAMLGAAQAGGLDGWLEEDPHSALALIIVLDQFPRNVWRGTARAYSCDARALAASRRALKAGHVARLLPVQRTFLLMPFQHSESLANQRESVRLFAHLVGKCPPAWRAIAQNTLEFARKHHAIVERFGRFPHRNAVLGRESTREEAQWLASGGDTFGQ